MPPHLSNNEISVLEALWELKALGTHGVTLQQLAVRLSDLAGSDASVELRNLERRSFVARRRSSGQEFFSLNLLGSACVRQLLDRQLSDLTEVSATKDI